MKGESIRITGIVQGVGFRPCVWRLAHELGLVGQIGNDSDGVLISIWGSQQARDDLLQALEKAPPALAIIENIIRRPLDSAAEIPADFCIIESHMSKGCTGVAADAATCPDCLAEVLDPANRRYRYAFTNCTHCGPRLSIIKTIPYDRSHTSMAAFPICTQCQAEYDDPVDRRFHAQPNACPDCGPQLWLEDSAGHRLPENKNSDVIEMAADLIRAGHIVAIKGIGGIHLACDAGNEVTVASLRQRKHRDYKALALMARDLDMVKGYAELSESEAALLSDGAAPIVVLNTGTQTLAASVAPGQNSLGFMLPYTPLHHLLMQHLPRPIVLTSGNLSDEPQTIDNQAARLKLQQIADYYLLHDREIVNRLDDSVLRIVDDQPRMLRRARGYAPQPIRLPAGFATDINILAMGAELKNSFCLLQQGRVLLSQHIGDLEDAQRYQDYQHNVQLYRQLFDFTPAVIAVDQHPDYLSTQFGRALATEKNLPLIEVQHHHAHIAACMIEHNLPLNTDKVLGVVLDGLGYGDDGTLWGGEFLLADYQHCARLAHFQAVPLLGGAQASREPWRNTLAHLMNSLGWESVLKDYADLQIIRFLMDKPLATLQTMADKGLNSPPASSAGRLFDAVAAALGLCRESISFEGQAAIELEALAAHEFEQQAEYAYGFAQQNDVLNWTPLWSALLNDLATGITVAKIAARFHHGIAAAVATTARRLCQQHKIQTVVLSGGVFQNRLLLERSSQLLRQQNFQVLSASAIPANDGGISLGQAVIAQASS
ncbi:[NiFe] hydrogenase metallocenter assembly protein HypF [hydrothermal vent metagenome]|uniref:Carbamoyl phosphate-converting enzyme HypF n=1 Tax=hydrothermal vent metagenome TaxID=652676 RepID=A0A3B1AQI5_9ZZZZ